MAAVLAEIGLRLLFCPLTSNVVVQTACCSVGLVLPVYSTFKSIESKDQTEQQKWLHYWAVYGSFSLAEILADKLLSWFPLYYRVKFAFLVWLQLPTIGAGQLYMNHLRPFLLRHQAVLDRMVSLVYGEIAKFIIVNQAELQFVRTAAMKLLSTGNQMLRDVFRPIGRQENRTIGGPRRQIQGVESEEDD